MTALRHVPLFTDFLGEILKPCRFDLERHLTEALAKLAKCKGSAFEGHGGGVALF